MATGMIKAATPDPYVDVVMEIKRFLEMAQRRCEVCEHPRRRMKRRYHRSWPMTVRLPSITGQEEFAVALHNANEHGIAFLTSRDIGVDERVRIKLFWYEPDGACVPAVVRHCTATRYGNIVGCEFVRC